MQDPGVAVHVGSRVKPVQRRPQGRLYRDPDLREHSPAAQGHVGHVDHEGHDALAAVLDGLGAEAGRPVAEAVEVRVDGAPDPVVHDLVVLGGELLLVEPELGRVGDRAAQLHGDVDEVLVLIHHLGSPELAVGLVLVAHRVRGGLGLALGLLDHGVDLPLFHEVVEEADLGLLI